MVACGGTGVSRGTEASGIGGADADSSSDGEGARSVGPGSRPLDPRILLTAPTGTSAPGGEMTVGSSDGLGAASVIAIEGSAAGDSKELTTCGSIEGSRTGGSDADSNSGGDADSNSDGRGAKKVGFGRLCDPRGQRGAPPPSWKAPKGSSGSVTSIVGSDAADTREMLDPCVGAGVSTTGGSNVGSSIGGENAVMVDLEDGSNTGGGLDRPCGPGNSAIAHQGESPNWNAPNDCSDSSLSDEGKGTEVCRVDDGRICFDVGLVGVIHMYAGDDATVKLVAATSGGRGFAPTSRALKAFQPSSPEEDGLGIGDDQRSRDRSEFSSEKASGVTKLGKVGVGMDRYVTDDGSGTVLMAGGVGSTSDNTTGVTEDRVGIDKATIDCTLEGEFKVKTEESAATVLDGGWTKTDSGTATVDRLGIVATDDKIVREAGSKMEAEEIEDMTETRTEGNPTVGNTCKIVNAGKTELEGVGRAASGRGFP
ncbi:hypothetical protein OPT61_g143 [Boeremia exigua]|uniref:Uncharacterized protein n=1 Tax=Boeremia exigua TaxID=749465 RepID=A0ACC2IUX2_9PLEO|nr:hypothetical protein OPT61_g143 [Boeremia exigua]